jgi:hypothetical protein
MTRISVSLEGGIGNLLFQYSAALKLRNQLNYKVSLEELSPGLKVRLEKYVGEIEFMTPRNQRKVDSAPAGKPNRLTTKWVPDFSPSKEPYSKRVRFLKGYFQHPSWYLDSLEIVLEKLDLHRHTIALHTPKNLTAIHLRRSDYVRLGWDLPMSYYDKAFAIDSNIAQGPVAIFSDDKIVSDLFEQRLCTAGLTIYNNDEIRARSAFNDFFTIANSQRIVMSNSTFCWWAVKLAQSSNNKAVAYCPPTWLPASESNILIDSSWVKIQ